MAVVKLNLLNSLVFNAKKSVKKKKLCALKLSK